MADHEDRDEKDGYNPSDRPSGVRSSRSCAAKRVGSTNNSFLLDNLSCFIPVIDHQGRHRDEAHEVRRVQARKGAFSRVDEHLDVGAPARPVVVVAARADSIEPFLDAFPPPWVTPADEMFLGQ